MSMRILEDMNCMRVTVDMEGEGKGGMELTFYSTDED